MKHGSPRREEYYRFKTEKDFNDFIDTLKLSKEPISEELELIGWRWLTHPQNLLPVVSFTCGLWRHEVFAYSVDWDYWELLNAQSAAITHKGTPTPIEFINTKVTVSNCECGSHVANAIGHSTWCPSYKEN